MITVRFPSGFSVQYNSASTVQSDSSDTFQRLKTADDKLVARVPMDCIIEFSIPPCRTYNACQADYNDQRLAAVEKEMRTLKNVVRKSLRKEAAE